MSTQVYAFIANIHKHTIQNIQKFTTSHINLLARPIAWTARTPFRKVATKIVISNKFNLPRILVLFRQEKDQKADLDLQFLHLHFLIRVSSLTSSWHDLQKNHALEMNEFIVQPDPKSWFLSAHDDFHSISNWLIFFTSWPHRHFGQWRIRLCLLGF